MDRDVAHMEAEELRDEVLKLRGAIRDHCDRSVRSLVQAVPELWSFLPESPPTRGEAPTWQQFAETCPAFRELRTVEPEEAAVAVESPPDPWRNYVTAPFEVHITGDSSIHAAAGHHGIKTIAVDLLRPDGSIIRTEHMTSLVARFPDLGRCKTYVDDLAVQLKAQGVRISRVKIETPFQLKYARTSLYMEAHFPSSDNRSPMSRNAAKTECLGTERAYEVDNYYDFMAKHKGNVIELCVHDSEPLEDFDWMELYPDGHNISGSI